MSRHRRQLFCDLGLHFLIKCSNIKDGVVCSTFQSHFCEAMVKRSAKLLFQVKKLQKMDGIVATFYVFPPLLRSNSATFSEGDTSLKRNSFLVYFRFLFALFAFQGVYILLCLPFFLSLFCYCKKDNEGLQDPLFHYKGSRGFSLYSHCNNTVLLSGSPC